MTTVERYIELRARLEELESFAGHIPPAVLAERLVEIVAGHMEAVGSPVETTGIRERVGKIQESPTIVEKSVRFAPITHHDPERIIPGRDGKHYRAGDLHDSGMPFPGVEPVEEPSVSTQRTIPGTKLPAVEEADQGSEPETNIPDPIPEEPEASGEPEKLCTKCGKTKSLSEFYAQKGGKDGCRPECKDCTRELRQARYRKRRTENAAIPKANGEVEKRPESRGSAVTPIKSATTDPVSTETRLCANGARCAAVHPDDLVPQPAILADANQHPSGLCRRCQQRAGVA